MLRLITIVWILVVAAPFAYAEPWSHTVEFQRTDRTTLRVVEPEGYQITVNGKTEAAPVVFSLPNADSYVTMGVRSPAGATWERKIEVKAWTQSIVRIQHTADAPRPAAKPAFMGIVVNTTHLCRAAADRRDMRVEFLRDADLVRAIEVGVRTRVDAELPAGEYRVRRYFRGAGGWEFAAVDSTSVGKDGWIYQWGCSAGK